MQTENTILKLDINLLIPNKYQPRKEFEETELSNLAESIKIYGILNPILTREKDGKYEIIAGERRYRAAKIAGLNQVPVIVKEATDEQMAELALIENVQRRDLSPIEEAKSYDEIIKLSNQTQDELAKKIGKSQSFVANKIRLLALPEEIQQALADRKISERHARSLLTVDTKETQIELLNKIIEEKLTVKETEQLINQKEITEEEIKQAINDIMKSLNLADIEEEVEDKKEEKEDDNMNNGNFFPNYDNNNTSLNMMNMQSMGPAYMEPQNDIVMPTPNIISNPMGVTPEMSAPQFAPSPEPPVNLNMQQPVNVMPVDNGFTNNSSFATAEPVSMPEFIGQPQVVEPVLPQPEFVQSQPVTTSDPTPMMQDTPLFNPSAFEVPVSNEPQMVMPTPEPVVMPEPVVTEPVINTPVMNEPVTIEPVVVETKDKLTSLQELLNNNGYAYKVYSNETNHCIIIELPKN